VQWFLKGIQVAILLDRIWEFFWHLIGPDDVPMDKRAERNLLKAIELVGRFGEQVVILDEPPKLFDSFFAAIQRFQDIGMSYRNNRVRRAVTKQLVNVKKELLEAKAYPQRDRILNNLERELRHLVRR
jgi:hypothetical protein